MKRAIAIFTSDWHWWPIAPVFRSVEKDWIEAQSRPLKQIKQFQEENKCPDGKTIPVVFAGDMFDHYNPCPAAINALLAAIPSGVVGIPGQHDLEHHVLENIEKTGFYTLVQAGAVYMPDIFAQPVQTIGDKCNFYFCPWGVGFEDIEPLDNGKFNILVAHKYVWFGDNTRYGGGDAPGGKLSGMRLILQKFDYAVFGDNHIPFTAQVGKCQVVNCGTMNRRKQDERTNETGFAVLYEDGELEFIPFNHDQDKTIIVETGENEINDATIDARDFFEEINGLKDCDIDFRDHVERKAVETGDKQVIETFAKIFNNYEAR